MEVFCTFLGEPEVRKHVQQFYRALNEHYSKGGKHLDDPAKMETLSNKHAPRLFAQLYKSILNDDKEKPSKKTYGNAEDKSCVIVTQSQFLLQPGICFNSKGFVLYIQETPLLFQVLIYPCTIGSSYFL